MNYLRGAVSAISAPYHYYNQINPSTLTGAIDVIVVQRPAKDGSTELACSPFHVRLGKWKVLRPSDKRVNVSVNGNQIPYDMKIGDAGEAFFVFETDEDVPEDLITSPLLQPTRTERESAADNENDRAGAPATHGIPDLKQQGARPRLASEPEFLDLDALPQGKVTESVDAQLVNANSYDYRSSTMDEQDKQADEALAQTYRHHSVVGPDVEFRRDVVLDIEGYHAPEQPDQTPKNTFIFPSFVEHLPDSDNEPPPRSTTPSTSSDSSDSNCSTRRNSLTLHLFRPTSESPPDIVLTSADDSPLTRSSETLIGSSLTSPGPSSPAPGTPPLHAVQQQEYSWEWGGFPTPSPMRDHFPSVEGDHVSNYLSAIEREGDEADNEGDVSDRLHGRTWKRGRKKSQCKSKLDNVVGSEDNLNDDADMSLPEERRLPYVRSKSEPPEEVHPPTVSSVGQTERPQTKKLSWVQWWSRRRKVGNTNIGSDGDEANRPILRESTTAPPTVPLYPHEVLSTPRPGLLAELEPITSPAPPKKKYAKTLRLTSDQLKALNLKQGPNIITFSLSASGAIACTARIFVWDHIDQVVISDIDGTITKSDGLGHVFAMIGRDWTHPGVAKLYTDITRNGYKILYLTSRAIGQADATRYYLKGIKQNDYQLPDGPVIMSPDRLMASLHREVIMRKPEMFKMACLRDIRNLFGESNRNPFYAGFGNRITDALSYRSVNVSSSRIFTIDTSGEVRMELLELAGYKSSYIHMTDLVDQMFPPINKKWTPEYTDFNYWRTPVPEILLPVLTPPSPALSARSDDSTRSALARLRNFSLTGSKQVQNEREENGGEGSRNKVHTRLSSLERLSNSLVNGLRRSISPDSRSESSTAYGESDADSEGEWDTGANGKTRKRRGRRERGRSIGSMPGSLSDMHFFGLDEYDEEPVFGEFEGSEGEQQEDGELQEGDLFADEQALEEDLFVAGEMQNVPFL